ncbi:MAG TPA: proline dehydrogenase family protein [Solirubrobacteraceae bacterium]|jgi:RHH-type proline utilization regulon transcriptional repressor/proline dehydrogenase/delta 1-pyrroline-5-carboxylate dehydrogenase
MPSQAQTAPGAAPDPAIAVDPAALQAEIERIGAAIAGARPGAITHPLRSADKHAMRLATGDEELRAALFRLVDVTPACRNVEDIGAHLASFTADIQDSRPASLAHALSDTRAGRMVLGRAVAAGVRHTARRFIAGEGPREAADELARMWEAGIASSLDLLGEATVSAEEADAYAARCLETIEQLAQLSRGWPPRAALEHDSAGTLARANLSVKLSSLTAQLRAAAPARGAADAAPRLRPLLSRAGALGAHIHIDMESLDALETTIELALALLQEPAFRDGPSVGIVIQAYLRESPALVERVLAWAGATPRATPVTVRLVKGAYWDHEVAEARQHGWGVPVFTDKAECDRNFEALTRQLLSARPLVRVAIASHNLRSIAHAVAWNRLSGGKPEDLELQVLRGLGDDLAAALARSGARVRVYAPVGDLVAGMAYLVRRLLENTSNESFLLAEEQGVPLAQLLAAP